MKSSWRDTLLIVTLFVLLIGFMAFSAIRQSDEQNAQRGVPYASTTANNRGTLLLYEWLTSMGYRTQRLTERPLAIPNNVDMLLMLPSQDGLTQNEVDRIQDWVAAGHILVLGTNQGSSDEHQKLLEAFDINIIRNDEYIKEIMLRQPTFADQTGPISIDTLDYVRVVDRPVVVHAIANVTATGKTDLPVLVSFTHEQGHVIVTSAPAMFTNSDLQDERTSALVRGMFRHLPPSAVIAFEEAHRDSVDPNDADGLMMVLTNTSWGRALLFGLIAVFVYLAVNGRRFGRVMPLRQDIQRRNAAEYATGMANLMRRAGQRNSMAHHYAHQLKLRLGRPYAIGANLSDDEFVEQLRHASDDDNATQSDDWRTLRDILTNLNAPKLSEADLLRWVQAANQFQLRQ